MASTLASVRRTVVRGWRPVIRWCCDGAARCRARWRASLSVLLAVPLLVSVASRTDAEPTAPLKIGVLDIRVIFERYEQIPVIERELQGEIGRYQGVVADRRERMDALERAERGAPQARPSAREMTQARAALREARREAIEELRLLEERATAAVLADVRRAAASEAAAKELDLVIDRTDASLLFVQRHGPHVVDVTDAVLARMNAP